MISSMTCSSGVGNGERLVGLLEVSLNLDDMIERESARERGVGGRGWLSDEWASCVRVVWGMSILLMTGVTVVFSGFEAVGCCSGWAEGSGCSSVMCGDGGCPVGDGMVDGGLIWRWGAAMSVLLGGGVYLFRCLSACVWFCWERVSVDDEVCPFLYLLE